MFSGTVKIQDLNDYLKPSEECIVIENQENDLLKDDLPDLIKSKEKKATIKIDDCLACSGCLTTSETIMIQEQGIERMLEDIQKYEYKIAIVSNYSWLSIANKLQLTEKEAYNVLIDVLQKWGFNLVIDFHMFIEICNMIEYQKFLQYKKDNKMMLSCECPGWVTYMEKTLDEQFVKYSSCLQTPQMITGIFIKRVIAYCMDIDINSIYTVLIAPCFDKKIEVLKSKQQIQPLNIVCSTKEVFDRLIKDQQYSLQQQQYFDMRLLLMDIVQQQQLNLNKYYVSSEIFVFAWNFDQYGNSNNYMDFMINELKLNNYEVILLKENKKKNLIEYELDKNGECLKMAIVYGFKNLQNLIRKVKKKKAQYSYCEVMACPQGCISGGGQLSGNEPTKETLYNINELNLEKEYFNNRELSLKFINTITNNTSTFLYQSDLSQPIKIHTNSTNINDW